MRMYLHDPTNQPTGESWAPAPAVRLHLWASPGGRGATLVKSPSQRRNTVHFRGGWVRVFVLSSFHSLSVWVGSQRASLHTIQTAVNHLGVRDVPMTSSSSSRGGAAGGQQQQQQGR